MNVLDKFKDMSPEEIRADYVAHASEGIAVMLNWEHDFNISQLIRNANFFGLKKVIQVSDSRRADLRGAVGTHNYIDFVRVKSWVEAKEHLGEYTIYGVENNVDRFTVVLSKAHFERKSCFVFGSESSGVPKEILDDCYRVVTIPAYGTVRSLNVGSTSAVVFNQYREYIA